MPLKISLKPNEKFFIGGAVVENGGSHAELTILNEVPLLREKDVMKEEAATTPCRRLYLCVQLMYMDSANQASYLSRYLQMMSEVMEAAPSTGRFLVEMNNDLAKGRYYQALKVARQLVEYEQELTTHESQPA